VYPLLRHPTGVRLTFTPVGGLVSSANMRVFDAGLTGAPLPLPTGRMISIKVYLQRFLDGFRPGRFDIPWEISVPCEGKSNASSTRGILTINIIQAENPSLQAEFATLVTRAGTRDEEARRNFTETPLRVQEAIEALRVATSPLVLPFLEQLAGSSDSYAQDEAVANRAIPYTRRFAGGKSEWSDARKGNPARGSSAGGGYSTVDDLLRFDAALRAHTFGAGGGRAGLGIAGGSPGTNALLESLGDYTIVVLANMDPPAAERLGVKIRAWLPRPGASPDVAVERETPAPVPERR